MTPRRLQAWAGVVVGAAMVSGCSAAASDAPGQAALAALSATPKGGVLACSGGKASGVNPMQTVLWLANYNDEGAIAIDRIDVYGVNGTKYPCAFAPGSVDAHQLWALVSAGQSCIPTGTGLDAGFTVLVYWSYGLLETSKAMGQRNPLDGWTVINITDPSNGVMRTQRSRECKAISAEP